MQILSCLYSIFKLSLSCFYTVFWLCLYFESKKALYLIQQKLKNKKPWQTSVAIQVRGNPESNKRKLLQRSNPSKKKQNPGSPLGFFIYIWSRSL